MKNPRDTGLKVGVHGAGAIGCYVGGRLAAAGEDVVFVGRPRVQAELQAAGLTLIGLSGASVRVAPGQVRIGTDPATLADRDVILCCVKSAQSAAAAAELAPLVSPRTVVVSLQNGLRNVAVLQAGLPGQPIHGAVVGFNVVPRGAGVFRQATGGAVILSATAADRERTPADHRATAPPDPPDPRVTALAQALARAGIPAPLVRDIQAHQWAKLLMNLNNAVSALSGAPSRDLLFVPGYRRVVAALVTEAIAVLRAAKIHPVALRGIPVRLLPLMLRLPTPLVKVVARAQLKFDPEARSSMWEDLSHGRPTEVDDLNGEIVRLAASVGAAAPLNRRIVEQVHHFEAQGQGSPKLTPAVLWAALTT